MTTEIAIIKQENINLIVQEAPQAYKENQLSHDRCLEYGRNLIETIRRQGGMSDELDEQAAKFISMAKATIRKMNEKRSPLTKLFDEIRTQFTTFENEIDPGRKDTVPYQLQQLRNQYAAHKRAEEERKTRELIMRQQAEQARAKYLLDITEEYKNHFSGIVNSSVNRLLALNTSITLENLEQKSEEIKGFPCTLSGVTFQSSVMLPVNVPAEELAAIRKKVYESLLPKFQEQYLFELETNRDAILDILPSKKQELERAAQASSEEAERIRRQMAERDAQEAERKEQERRQREEHERQTAAMKQKAAEVNDLFTQAEVSKHTYNIKASVKKTLMPLNTEAFPEIIALWWTNEGQHLSVDELGKILKKQLSFCEKLANDKGHPIFIQSEHIEYVDDVKAK